MLAIVGAMPVRLTVNGTDVVNVPAGEVTVIGPLVAAAGTATLIDVVVTVDGAEAMPLNETVVLVLVPNPVPVSVTVVPAGALSGDH